MTVKYMKGLDMENPFSLSEEFIEPYKGNQPKWGPVGYFVYKRTYARPLEKDNINSPVEEFWQTCRRVVELVFNVQKAHCEKMNLPWKDRKAKKSAEDMFERMWAFKFTPPGRGIWSMDKDILQKKSSSAVQNCAFFSSKDIDRDFAKPFCKVMDFSMLGVGCGFDIKGKGKVIVGRPEEDESTFTVKDTREGWVELLELFLRSITGESSFPQTVDYSHVRPKGARLNIMGGVSSGPQPLIDLIENLKKLFDHERREISGPQIVDTMNYIGKCVVSGGIRRCLPGYSLVHTSNGLKKIKDVSTNDHVLTSKGFQRVLDFIDQGKQDTLNINTQMGSIECTGNHRVAVMYNTKGEYVWKEARHLSKGDRLVFIDQCLEGLKSVLPEYEYSKGVHSTTCQDISVPPLDTGIAWLLGNIAGDGYVRVEDTRGCVSVSTHGDDIGIINKAKEQLSRFGARITFSDQLENDNRVCVKAHSKQLAQFMSQFKKPNVSIDIPNEIMQGSPEQRCAYLAGLCDADGSLIGRPINVCSTIYPDFAYQVQSLYSSLGIITKRKKMSGCEQRIEKGWKPLWSITVVGKNQKIKFKNLVAKHCVKNANIDIAKRSQNSYGFPAEWIESEEISFNSKQWSKQSKQMTVEQYEKQLSTRVKRIPIEVLSLEEGSKNVHTYDITVEGDHEFLVNGILVHNSAEIAFGEHDDEEFMDLKMDQEALWDRRWASNNSLFAKVGMDYTSAAKRTAFNGEPGYAWLENMQDYSRMCDPPDNKDYRVAGGNPCNEQSLEDNELCTLVENFPAHCDGLDDFLDTLKMSYLYAKTITLMPTHDSEVNSVMQRNRRIGCSLSGIIQAMNKVGRREFLDWCNEGYSYLQELDKIYSEWLGVPRSIKITSVKPSGTVSKLCGATSGIHFPQSKFYINRIRLSNNSPLVKACVDAGYHVEDAEVEPDTVIVEFPIKVDDVQKDQFDASCWEQLANAIDLQHYWADNQVSCTITFQQHEKDQIKPMLEFSETRLKGISFLPLPPKGEKLPYKQPPIEFITEEQYVEMSKDLKELNLGNAIHEAEDKFCDGASCEIKANS